MRINNLLNQSRITLAGSLSADIIDLLAVNPYVTINKIAEYQGISYSTAQRIIQKL